MDPAKTLHDVAAGLAQIGPVYVYINEYRLTHRYLHLRLTGNGYHDHIGDLYLSDCFHICGPTDGGPWDLVVREVKVNGDKCIVLSDGTGDFSAQCLRIVLTRA